MQNQAITSQAQHKLKDLTDLELISGALQSGHNIFFGELYDRYSDKVYGKCILMVKDLNIA